MRSDQIRQGRLSGERSANLEHFLASMDADRWIAEADLLVDMAHLLGLRRQGIIDEAPARALMAALLDLHDHGLPAEAFDERFEDIHAGKEAASSTGSGRISAAASTWAGPGTTRLPPVSGYA